MSKWSWFPPKHVHTFGKWEIARELERTCESFKVLDCDSDSPNHRNLIARIVEQRRTCSECGWTEINKQVINYANDES